LPVSANTQLVRRYLAAMAKGDLEGVTACFSADGVVLSPVYGTVPVRAFYERLFADTVRAEVDIRTIYVAEDRADRVVAHFAYRWERMSAPMMDTHLLDLFDLTPDGQRIMRLRILFDDGAAASAA
jgi:ketosteroid isomerase-like protein